MRPAYELGYLSWGALPTFARPRHCRYCNCEMESPHTHPICPAEDCQRRKVEARRLKQRRWQRKYDQKRRAS